MRSIQGWVFYDGSCGFCSKWVMSWKKTLEKRGFEIVPLQSQWVGQKTGLREEQLLKDFQLLLTDNHLISGSQAYLFLMQKIWWAWPFAMLFRLPGLRWLFDKVYRSFNRNRFAISKACRLSPPVNSHKKEKLAR